MIKRTHGKHIYKVYSGHRNYCFQPFTINLTSRNTYQYTVNVFTSRITYLQQNQYYPATVYHHFKFVHYPTLTCAEFSFSWLWRHSNNGSHFHRLWAPPPSWLNRDHSFKNNSLVLQSQIQMVIPSCILISCTSSKSSWMLHRTFTHSHFASTSNYCLTSGLSKLNLHVYSTE